MIDTEFCDCGKSLVSANVHDFSDRYWPQFFYAHHERLERVVCDANVVQCDDDLLLCIPPQGDNNDDLQGNLFILMPSTN